MTEADILAQLQTGRYNLSVISSQMLGLIFALILACYYFLHETRLLLRILIFSIFTAGYAALLFLFAWESIHMDGLEIARWEIEKSGEISKVGSTLMNKWQGIQTPLPDILTVVVLAAGWVTVGFVMFFYEFWTETSADPEISETQEKYPDHAE